VNKDGKIDQSDVDRLNSILSAPDIGGIQFKLLTKDDYDKGIYTNVLQTINESTIPSLTQETVFDGSFTGLQPNTKYIVLAYKLRAKSI